MNERLSHHWLRCKRLLDAAMLKTVAALSRCMGGLAVPQVMPVLEEYLTGQDPPYQLNGLLTWTGVGATVGAGPGLPGVPVRSPISR